ncbi:hypothetical protein EDC04DRAFT_1259019 [Pisolithus marmoratus]|nr:hypothetical protein EDC04DRAFT_1259019 [Pisolithus marmoratus]
MTTTPAAFSTQGGTGSTSASTANIPSSWDFPQNISTIFPKGDRDQLSGKDNYHVWAVHMQNAFEVCGLQAVVGGAAPRPPPGGANETVWLKMNASARTVIVQCISSSLVMKTSASSIVHWFSRLSSPMQPTDNISTHVAAFQDAYRHLANSRFVIPESCAAGLLLSTLYKDPKDPNSWDRFIKGACVTETTTLSNIVNLLLKEKRHPNSGNKAAETALAAQERNAPAGGRKWCRNCQRTGHTYDECRSVGGGREGQRPKRKQPASERESRHGDKRPRNRM